MKFEKVRFKKVRFKKGMEAEKEMRLKKEQEGKEMRELKGVKQLLVEEDGMGTVEIILIIVVLVGLVIVFKSQITDVVNNIFKMITEQTNKV